MQAEVSLGCKEEETWLGTITNGLFLLEDYYSYISPFGEEYVCLLDVD